MSDHFSSLIAWYVRHCDGNWEHQHGFELTTLDNPGIRLRVDLNGTDLANEPFTPTDCELESPDAWLHVEKTVDGYFDGCGAPAKINEIIAIFLKWADRLERTKQ